MATIYGTPYPDVLDGGIGHDTLTGYAGNDTLNGGQGEINRIPSYPYDNYELDETTDGDMMIGGLGDDLYKVTATKGSVWGYNGYVAISKYTPHSSFYPDIVIEQAREGNDIVLTFVSYTLPSNVENLELSTSFGVNDINGTGNSLDNLITGNDGKNKLYGKDGNDTLIGGDGKDMLTGGLGNDTFDFNALSEIGSKSGTRDAITDFVSGQDKIDLSTLDANEEISGNQGFSSLTIGNLFSPKFTFTHPGELYFDNVTYVLYGNTDTDSTPEFAINLMGATITGFDVIV